jgi:2-C-methyl-D-erythritol 2,4-cyclodiphosphate synthase
MKIGIGYDAHQLIENRALILGGVTIPYEKGLAGHSDADVLIHAMMDAILGALNVGSIGDHFPDTNKKYKDISSIKLLLDVAKLMRKYGYVIGNIDSVITAQEPKLKPYIEQMKMNLATALGTTVERVSVKATTTEQMGFEGRKEGLSAQSVVLLTPKE